MKTATIRALSTVVAITMLMGAIAQPAFASVPPIAREQATAQPSQPIDPQDLAAFLDGLLAAEMAGKNIPGAVVVVVADGKVLLAKGYGYADLAQRTPVEPERTLFRPGSVSKLFTWTAVLQLVEAGKLSLDTDVNDYLDFAIPATFPEPITLRHLLSHTPGFEDVGEDLFKLQAEQVVGLDAYLKRNLPVRVFPPGAISVYSNYGTALAGYIVERVSGQPFNEYVEQHIFAPLGMTHSTFQQPLPESLARDMATGYNYTNGQYIEGSFEFIPAYPAGALSTTATDMARFMIAHLQDGELEGQRILQAEAARQMHSRLYTADPRLNGGMAHGFFEKTINGQRILMHGGATILFHSSLYLIPEQNIGIFLSTNSTGGTTASAFGVGKVLIREFFDRYYPVAEAAQPQSAPGFAERIALYLGGYTNARSNFTTFEKIFALFSPINASLGDDETLLLSMMGQGMRYIEVEPGLLQDVDEPANRLVYRTEPDGRRFLVGSDPWPLFRTPWYGNGNLHLLLFALTTLLFLGALIGWPIGFFKGRSKRSTADRPTPLLARLARWAAALFGLLWLLLLVGLVTIFLDILPGFGVPRIFFETPPLLYSLMLLPFGLGGLAVIMLIFALLAWVQRYWGWVGRTFYSVLALLALLLTWSLTYWNLLL